MDKQDNMKHGGHDFAAAQAWLKTRQWYKTAKEEGNKLAIEILESEFPELAESKEEKIRKEILEYFSQFENGELRGVDITDWISWLEKQNSVKAIQWDGYNLKEVLDFVGKDYRFYKWFKSFDEYSRYVMTHGSIFKLFNEDGSHYEVPVGAWIVKTPDGYNVASQCKFKSAKCKEDEDMIELLIAIFQVNYPNGVYKVNPIGTSDMKAMRSSEIIKWFKSVKDRIV